MNVDRNAKIPNNVGLADDKRLTRALERWLPLYLEWWNDMGPVGFQAKDIYLRTAISVEAGGWANFDYVQMPDYRWGIFLAPHPPDRTIPFGDHFGQAGVARHTGRVSRKPPPHHRDAGRHRTGIGRAAAIPRAGRAVALRHAKPVSSERGGGPPPLGEWSTCCSATSDETAATRRKSCWSGRSGDEDKPRSPERVQQPVRPLAQLLRVHALHGSRRQVPAGESVSESGFDPLSRTCDFMLTEEAHHLFVGETGSRSYRSTQRR